ncbi:hypothetical protein ACRARG_05770 [Pseudooceanicola sp. C21-150M6]|uniref:hypothetical protein n=1 Tax=Pseudooceanicola sp. C21-150M6 TaxID=3434355 RepID=UPI003D7FDD6F
MMNAIVMLGLVATGLVLSWPRLARAPLWRAAITPLASIIGSGFLILGPVLGHAFGGWAPLAMAALCGLAWLLGRAIRSNIARIAAGPRTVVEQRLDTLASAALTFAYVISVAYYLNLFGAFALEKTGITSPVARRVLTTAVYLAIAATGWLKGFGALERLEQLSVTLKLAVIGGLLAGLAVHFGDLGASGGLVVSPSATTGWAALTLGMGLIVTVQGFETSRYLDDEYKAPLRIRSMRVAQLTATAIYMGYILLLTYAFPAEEFTSSETGIIRLMEDVAPLLPALLILAALTAQFSAAVADTGGAGGLLEELSARRLAPRHGYVVLAVAGIGLTWTSDVFEIVSYASRAFAFYYAVQSAIAAKGTLGGARTGYGLLALLSLAVTVFGTPVEAG